MGSTPSDGGWSPMRLTDQAGLTAYAWFPPGTVTDSEHVLPQDVYAGVCRLAGVSEQSPWVAFRGRAVALEALAAARLAVGTGTAPLRPLPTR